jgi:hypothetical protein
MERDWVGWKGAGDLAGDGAEEGRVGICMKRPFIVSVFPQPGFEVGDAFVADERRVAGGIGTMKVVFVGGDSGGDHCGEVLEENEKGHVNDDEGAMKVGLVCATLVEESGRMLDEMVEEEECGVGLKERDNRAHVRNSDDDTTEREKMQDARKHSVYVFARFTERVNHATFAKT